MKPASTMTSEAIREEIASLGKRFEDFRKDLDGMSGSPGEWMYERLDELDTELRRRRAYR